MSASPQAPRETGLLLRWDPAGLLYGAVVSAATLGVLAHDVAGRHMRPGLDNDEILQRAYEALARAARDFDPGRNRDFLAFAISEIQRELEELSPRTEAVPGAAGWTPGT